MFPKSTFSSLIVARNGKWRFLSEKPSAVHYVTKALGKFDATITSAPPYYETAMEDSPVWLERFKQRACIVHDPAFQISGHEIKPQQEASRTDC